MKTKFVLASCVAALSGLAGLAATASAAPDVHVRVNLGLPRPPVVVIAERGPDRPDWYSRQNRGGGDWYDHQRERNHPEDRGRVVPSGYWKEVVVKHWIPGHWEISYDRRGCERRDFIPAHAEYHTRRIWVDGCR